MDLLIHLVPGWRASHVYLQAGGKGPGHGYILTMHKTPSSRTLFTSEKQKPCIQKTGTEGQFYYILYRNDDLGYLKY